GAIVDQALFGISNFGLNMALARWLSDTAYGAFSLVSSLFLYIITVHSALIIEPSFVFAPGRFGQKPFGYLRTLIGLHLIVILIIGAGLLLAGAAIVETGNLTLGDAVAGMAIAGPITLSLWLLRRIFYVVLSPWSAARSGVIYLLLLGSMVGALVFQE